MQITYILYNSDLIYNDAHYHLSSVTSATIDYQQIRPTRHMVPQ